MVEERNELMTHAWPELRRFCRERQVELVEVDLRWGISEEQSTRKETLKLCLDEIRACRPFFIGLLGERYGWVPGPEALTDDLTEEQPWLRDLHGKSVTELEILHGVLNKPEMAGRAFFYFRDPAYARTRGADFLPEDPAAAARQAALKDLIRTTCAAKGIPLRESYPDPRRLATLVLEDLKVVIDAQYPKESIPDPLTREARDHEAFAESRRRVYIGRPDYFAVLDRHTMTDGGPLLLLGESGGGKSALLANWLAHWREKHPRDFIFQHYIGGTPHSAGHWGLMARLIGEIKRWTGDAEELPRSHDDILKSFPLWLARLRSKAEHDGVRAIIILDALNQLEDRDHARLFGWLPSHPFAGPLRLIVSTLPGDTLEAVEKRGWESLRVEPLDPDERRRMIAEYLDHFGKKLDPHRLERLAAAPPAANPLYLKILLDELRVTGTHERLDERLADYLAATDIPALLKKVLARDERDYERDRKGLVGEALGLIYAARRGLAEAELLRLLKPADLPQLPPAVWAPLRAALEESVVDRGGILNFAHEFLRAAVSYAFAPDAEAVRKLRLRLADYFEFQPASARSCDELPWLLRQVESRDRLRACLLNFERFLEIMTRDENELLSYWVWLGEERVMGKPYLASFEKWSKTSSLTDQRIAYTANQLAYFLNAAALYIEAESLYKRSLAIREKALGPDHPDVATSLDNLAVLYQDQGKYAEAEPLCQRSLSIREKVLGPDHPDVATSLNTLAALYYAQGRYAEAEPLFKRSLAIWEKALGPDHPDVAQSLNNLAELYRAQGKYADAEPLYKRSLAIKEKAIGPDHPDVAQSLNSLAELYRAQGKYAEAEPLCKRSLSIREEALGPDHPDVATSLNNLAGLYQDQGKYAEAEPLYKRSLSIWEKALGPDHPDVATSLNNLAALYYAQGKCAEAETLYKRSIAIWEKALGPDHPDVAQSLNNLAALYKSQGKYAEAEPLCKRSLSIREKALGPDHPDVARSLNSLAELYRAQGKYAEAEPLYKRSLSIREKALGPDHPDVATSLNNLAGLYYSQGKYAEAETLYKRSIAIWEKALGPDHPDGAQSLNNLAALYYAQGKYAEAEPLYKRSLSIREKALGLDHPDVVTDLIILAGLYDSQGKYAEAEPLMRRALEIDKKSFGKDHPNVARDLNNLALLLQATNRLKEAEPLYRRALEIDKKSFGKDHPNVARGLNNLAALLQATNRLKEAEPLMRRALEIDEKSFGKDHSNVAIDLNNLATLLQATNRLKEAEPLMRRALEILLNFTRAAGHPHPHLQTLVMNYDDLLKEMRMSHQQVLQKLETIGPEVLEILRKAGGES